jgi:hypothetical protein
MDIWTIPLYQNSCYFLTMLRASRQDIQMNKDSGDSRKSDVITSDVAEIACIRAEAGTLAKYLRQTNEQSANVIQNLALCLLANVPGSDLGPGDWKLNFAPRNGRPPTRAHIEITSAALAIAHGQAIPLGRYLEAAPFLDGETRRAFAEAMDPVGSSKWRLKFARARKGFPRSELKNHLILAKIGHHALGLRGAGKRWHEIYSEMHYAETLIKKAVRFVLATKSAENSAEINAPKPLQ